MAEEKYPHMHQISPIKTCPGSRNRKTIGVGGSATREALASSRNSKPLQKIGLLLSWISDRNASRRLSAVAATIRLFSSLLLWTASVTAPPSCQMDTIHKSLLHLRRSCLRFSLVFARLRLGHTHRETASLFIVMQVPTALFRFCVHC
eukprot:TRINITY_DN3425_c0_g1_i2.p1 TRINITY_DN3425_c0_g1~~TRINITY_DN3425_c0_g1_i2.p1  ORF type:complete len:173 (-),score=19.16 TRINITY_DN3425_c0_g1_i2:249-692(-)